MTDLKTRVFEEIRECSLQRRETCWTELNALFMHDAARGTIQKTIQDLIKDGAVVGVLTKRDGRIYEYLYTAEFFREKEMERIENMLNMEEFRSTLKDAMLTFNRMKIEQN